MTCCSPSRICGIIMQILVYASLILYLLTLYIDINIKSKIMLIVLIIVYVLYLITELCLPTFSFLRSKKNKDEVINALSKLIKTNPLIIYKFEVRNYNLRITGNIEFIYYSSRDVSGLLELDILKDDLKDKSYVALEIEQEINFADEISYFDFVNSKNIFNRRLKKGYYVYSLKDARSIPSQCNYYNLIRIGDKDPCFVNCFFFILFTIIPVVEIYKCYIYSTIYEKTFVIRKLISTRYDLNQEQYKVFNPYIKLLGQECNFESNDYNYINNKRQIKPPTEDELKLASQFNKKVPKYECESFININDEIKIGVIKDEPNYRDTNNGIFCYIDGDSSRIKNNDNNNSTNNNNNKVYIYNGTESKENLNMNEENRGNLDFNFLMKDFIENIEETKNVNENDDIINIKNELKLSN